MNNIVDSSAWLEYFADTKYAEHFSKIIEDVDNLIVPTICMYEVYKKIISQSSESIALKVVAHMKLGKVVDLDLAIALQAAQLSHQNKLPMADSIILATGDLHNATIWTLDSDFKEIKNVHYFSKK